MANLVKVEGEVVTKDGSGKAIEFYEESFVLDVEDKNQALSLIRKGLITDRLRRKTEGFKQVRTCQIVSINFTEEKPENDELTKVMLRAIELGCVPENIDNYKRPDYKLVALQKAIDNYEKRKKEQKPDNVTNKGVVND